MKHALVVLYAIAFSHSPVSAQEVIDWGDVAGWRVAVDTTVGGGCFMQSTFEDATAMRMGFEPSAGRAYLVLGNPKWKSIEAGKSYDVSVQVDALPRWNAAAEGRMIGSVPALYIPTTEIAFIEEVRTRHGIAVTYSGREIAKLSLAGTARAIGMVLDCQQSVNEIRANGGAQPPATSSDPFERDQVSDPSDPFAL